MNRIIQGDSLEVLKTLETESVDCCITSPPYWGLRDYGVEGQSGLEKTPEEYVANMVKVFSEVRRILKKEGTLWLNLGDSYSSGGRTSTTNQSLRGESDYGVTRPAVCDSVKHKDLVGIPWMTAFALRTDGWYLRQDIIWYKPNPMPESVTDRCTKAHEYIFLMARSQKYYFDNEAIKEPVSAVSLARAEYGWDCDRPSTKNASMNGEGIHTEKMGKRFVHPNGRNKRSVWTITTKPFKQAHFATFPMDLIEPMVKAGCPQGGVILDPFSGAGTTACVAKSLGRNYIGIELNTVYVKMSEERIANTMGSLL